MSRDRSDDRREAAKAFNQEEKMLRDFGSSSLRGVRRRDVEDTE